MDLVFLLGYAVLVVWTVRRLLLIRQDDPSLRFGVRVFGGLLWLALTIIWSVGDPHPSNMLLRVVLNAFLTLPPALWSGYFAGRRMRRVVGSGGVNR
jgi:hypothetical protein